MSNFKFSGIPMADKDVMASADIQIVNISNLEKIETFLNDSAYKEVLENSENYNTRLCIERRLRMPFLDPQTGVAQNHCALFMKRRQRMPGLREGQIYTYPSGRWRKSRRQYLIHQHRPFRMIREPDPESLLNLDGGCSSMGLSTSVETDTNKDTHRDDAPKDWFFDEVNMHEVDPFVSRDVDSDFDYEDNNYKKKRRGRKPNPDNVIRRGRGRGRGRRKNLLLESGEISLTRSPGPGRKPRHGFPMSLSSNPINPVSSPVHNSNSNDDILLPEPPAPPAPVPVTEQVSADDLEQHQMIKPSERGKAVPSPYCDFCLGDSRENKKTNIPEDLVSCSDCGRSGHPTCLQFTPNMIISVKRYRWQCIECKYCSICGTSDNDDQLLFCDDCDRGYHMYCLMPPLTAPPEGTWSCNICHEEFHSSTSPN